MSGAIGTPAENTKLMENFGTAHAVPPLPGTSSQFEALGARKRRSKYPKPVLWNPLSDPSFEVEEEVNAGGEREDAEAVVEAGGKRGGVGWSSGGGGGGGAVLDEAKREHRISILQAEIEYLRDIEATTLNGFRKGNGSGGGNHDLLHHNQSLKMMLIGEALPSPVAVAGCDVRMLCDVLPALAVLIDQLPCWCEKLKSDLWGALGTRATKQPTIRQTLHW